MSEVEFVEMESKLISNWVQVDASKFDECHELHMEVISLNRVFRTPDFLYSKQNLTQK